MSSTNYVDFSGIISAKIPHFHLLFLPILLLSRPRPPRLFRSPAFQKELLTDVVLYLFTSAHLPRPELSLSPIHSPLGSCISRGHYSQISPAHTGAVRWAVSCKHAININLKPAFKCRALPYMYLIHGCCALWRVFALKLHLDGV